MSNAKKFTPPTAAALTPFWRRLPKFFIYPVQWSSMLRIIGYAMVTGLSLLLPNPFGGLLYLIVWIMFLKYAFVVMERTANGQLDEPDDLNGNERGDAGQVMRQFGLFVVFGLCVGLLSVLLGRSAGYVIGAVLMSVVLPAGIMIIAVNKSLPQALNPFQILFYMGTIRSPYFALCFLIFSLSSSSEWLQEFFYEHLDSWLVLPLFGFIEFYFTLIIYHMMGYAVYQYHEKLGLDADVSFADAEAKQSTGKTADPLHAQLGELLAAGHDEAALDLLREALRTRWEENALHERYQKLLVASGKSVPAMHHAREFINKLSNEKRLFQALDLCEYWLKNDANFHLQDSFHVHPLATAARMGGRAKLALDLMRGFDKRYLQHEHIPLIYFLAAQILSENFQRHSEASAILHTLQTKFPDHPLANEASQYLTVLAKVAALG